MMPNDIDDDTRLIYIVEDEPSVGHLRDWVKAQEQAHYSGFGVSDHLWVVDNSTGATFTRWEPKIIHRYTSDDYAYTEYELGGQTATMKIDLRA